MKETVVKIQEKWKTEYSYSMIITFLIGLLTHLYKFAFLTNNYIIAISYFGKYIYAIINTKKGEVCNIDDSGFLSEKKYDK